MNEEILRDYFSKKPEINYVKLKNDLVDWIRLTVKTTMNDKTAVVIGMSGGKDSTVVAKLLSEALGSDRVYGLIMPNGFQADINDAQEACEVAGINYQIINIGDIYDNAVTQIFGTYNNDNAKIKTNLPSRLRTSMLYAFAAQYNDGNCLVVNTSNFSEKLMGWGTLWGDTVGDFSPLGALMVEDVISVGYVMDIPAHLLIKAPADGMSGKTDEEALGFSYDEIEYVYDNLYNKNVVKTENYDKIRVRMYNMQWKRDLIQLPTFKFVSNNYLM